MNNYHYNQCNCQRNDIAFGQIGSRKEKYFDGAKAPAGGYQEFLMNEARYSSLTRAFPERAKELFAQNEEAAKERYEHLTRLVELYK